MSRHRAITATVIFVGVLVLLLAPWPGLASLSTRLFMRALSAWCALCFRGHDFRVVLAPPAQAWTASLIVRSNGDGAVLGSSALDCWRAFHLPATVFLALSLSCPPRPRWLTATILVSGLCVLSALPLTGILALAARAGALHLGSTATALLVTGNRALWSPAGMSFIVPGVLWLGLWALCQQRRPLAPGRSPDPVRPTA